MLESFRISYNYTQLHFTVTVMARTHTQADSTNRRRLTSKAFYNNNNKNNNYYYFVGGRGGTVSLHDRVYARI